MTSPGGGVLVGASSTESVAEKPGAAALSARNSTSAINTIAIPTEKYLFILFMSVNSFLSIK
jgi:hypothetical protein